MNHRGDRTASSGNGNANGATANGAGSDPNPEVLPPYVEHQSDAAIRIGQVEFNHNTIVRSPCFWILVGIGLAWGISYCSNRRD